MAFQDKNFHHSLLLITPNPDTDAVLDLISPHSALDLARPSSDLLILKPEAKNSLGIDQIRLLNHFFTTAPVSGPHKVALILHAPSLTFQAQNALLKTLEEPPPQAQIILVASNPNQLLPTIVSRCHTIHLDGGANLPDSASPALPDLTNLGVGERLKLAEDYHSDPDTAGLFLNQLVYALRAQIKSTPTKSLLYNLTLTLYTQKLLRSNVNLKLALDHLFLNLK